MQRHLESAEMWFYRRMMQITWMKRISNMRVLEMANEKRSLMTTIRKRQLQFVGHIVREGGLEKVCLEGKIEGKRLRGKPRQKFLDGLVLVTSTDTIDMLHRAQNRSGFRSLVANVRV